LLSLCIISLDHGNLAPLVSTTWALWYILQVEPPSAGPYGLESKMSMQRLTVLTTYNVQWPPRSIGTIIC
jgi:hypothetical protein